MRTMTARAGLLLLGLAGACGPIEAVERGEQLFNDPGLSVSSINVFSCSTCHSSTESDSVGGRRLPGYTLRGAAARPSFWGGEYTLLLDAVGLCLETYMRNPRLAREEPKGLALLAYLQSLVPPGSGPYAARPLTVVQNVDMGYLASVAGGDAGRGEALYRDACAYCHGALRTGEGRLGPRISILPDDTVSVFGANARGIIVQKIRQGKFFGIGGVMPFYSKEALSDSEVADIATYVLAQ
jgi:thiosulfate dehydrogenase